MHAPGRLLWLLVFYVLLTSGCVLVDRDVSHDERFLIGYRPGEVYRLLQPVKTRQLEGGSLELLPPGAIRKYGKPGTLAEGALIKIISLRHYVAMAPFNGATDVTISAQIIGPPEQVVWIGAISKVRWIDGDKGLKTPVSLPDPKWLELVAPASTTSPTP